MNYSHLEIEKENSVMTISLDRPDKLNALNTPLMKELKQSLLEADADQDTKIIILRGNGKAFCSGADLKEFKNDNEEDITSITERANVSKQVYKLFHEIKKPVIASVHNYTLAGGCGLAMACDIVIATEDCKFGYPEVKKGIVAALVMPNLNEIVGPRRAMDLLLTGKTIDSSTAMEYGMLNYIVGNDELNERTKEIAESIAGFGGNSLKMIKQLFYQTTDLGEDSAFDLSEKTNIMMRLTREFQSGVSSFK